MRTRRTLATLTLIAVGLLALLWLTPTVAGRVSYAATKAANQADREALAGMEQAQQLSKLFRHVAKVVRPAVVEVRVARRVEAPRLPGMEDFFQDLPPGLRPRLAPRAPQRPRQFMQRGLGSGVIVDAANGYVLTNNHVVADADEVMVVLSDEKQLKAEWIRRDPKTDLAVLKVPAEGLIEAPLGDSDEVEVGDWVLAIGSPAGLEQTVTAGIISARDRRSRSLSAGDRYEDYLQTDAAINRGNSGGPLVNMSGQVIGINTAIVTPGGIGQNAGIGLSIPSNLARKIMRQLIDMGKVSRGYLGVSYREVEGALRVFTVLVGSPAEAGGMRVGDVLAELDGERIADSEDFRFRVAEMPPGSTHSFVVLRKGVRETLTVTLGEQPEDMRRPFMLEGSGRAPRAESFEALGITVAELSDELAQSLGFTSGAAGLVITDVRSAAAAAVGLRRGVLITRVDETPVSTVDEFKAALDAANLHEGIALRIEGPDGAAMTVLLTESQDGEPGDEDGGVIEP